MQDLKLKINKDSAARIRELPISKFIPNILTISAICAGFSSVKFAIYGDIVESLFCILIAVLLDGTDGRVARFLQKESHFGAELDSLADFLNFGVAPGLISYIISLKNFSNAGWGIALFSTICCALRLARFNTLKFYDDNSEDIIRPEFESNYSVGVAAPAGALIVLMPAFLYLATEAQFFLDPICFFVSAFIGGILMVSKVRTFVFKKVKVTPKRAPFLILCCCLFVISLITALWETMSVVIFVYLTSIPLSEKMYWKKIKEFDEYST